MVCRNLHFEVLLQFPQQRVQFVTTNMNLFIVYLILRWSLQFTFVAESLANHGKGTYGRTKVLQNCAVDNSQKIDCGFLGIYPQQCVDLGCCYEEPGVGRVPWCFQPGTDSPTVSPTSALPSISPTRAPTTMPSLSPSALPSFTPSLTPTRTPSITPTNRPTPSPSFKPTTNPTFFPTNVPTTAHPTVNPTIQPTTFPPTAAPSTLQPKTSEPSNTPLPSISHAPTSKVGVESSSSRSRAHSETLVLSVILVVLLVSLFLIACCIVYWYLLATKHQKKEENLDIGDNTWSGCEGKDESTYITIYPRNEGDDDFVVDPQNIDDKYAPRPLRWFEDPLHDAMHD